MRHHLRFSALVLLDIGQSVTSVQIDHDALGTPQVLGGSVVDFMVRQYRNLRSMAVDLIMQQHCLLFQYEDGTEARGRLELLLSDQCAILPHDESARVELWHFGDVLRLELVLKTPGLKNIGHTPSALVDFALTEMMRNAYRRLHALERPLTEWFFNVFLQTTQPTQIPFEVLAGYCIENRRPTPAEAGAVMKENAMHWKSELQSLGNQYLQATISDPKLLTLQNAALYQQLKRFFGEEV